MSVQSLIDQIAPFAVGWSRVRILGLIDQAQQKLCNLDSSAQWFIGSDNQGFPPYLKTVAGTYKYDITGANTSTGSITRTINGADLDVTAKKVLNVFIDAVDAVDYNMKYLGDPFMFVSPWQYSTRQTRVSAISVPVQTTPGLQYTAPAVIFKDDPGTTTDKYFCLFTVNPLALRAEYYPLSVDLEWEEALADYVMGRIQWISTGKQSDFMVKFEQYWMPLYNSRIIAELNAESDSTPTRIC